ncbi:MAG: Ig-like domain-containing protein, partial [Armatimonadetes bacterium]|nr:Ig-like domain-containing protein [Armatimonadota bacterium]
ITVRDAQGRAMAGIAAAQVVVAGSPTAGLTLTQPTTATNASGQTTATATCTKAGLVSFSATVAGVAFAEGADVTFQAGPLSAAQSTLSVDRASLTADGTDTATVTVTARDAQGNAITGVAPANVVLAAAPSTGVTLTQPTTATNASGQTTGTLVGTTVGTVTVSATVNGTAVIQTVQVGLVTAGIDAAGSGVAASATDVPADGQTPVTLTITLLASGGGPLAGIAASRLRIVANPSTGVTITQPSAATDAQGRTTATATSSAGGAVRFSATIDGGALGQVATVNFVAAAPDAARCTLVADKTSATADGADTVTFTATVRDANGNALAGIAANRLSLAVDIASGVTLGAFGTTDANGRATATATSTRSGARSFSLRVSGSLAGSPVAVSFTAGAVDAARSTLTADRAVAVANGQDSIVLTLVLRDALGNAKPGVPAAAVTFTSTGGTGSGLTLTGPAAASDASGRMTLSAKATAVQDVTLRVAVGGTAWTVAASFQPPQPSPSRSTVTLSPALIAADGAQQATVSVRLQDATGQPVIGSPASARSVSSSLVAVTVADAGAVSDANGAFEMRLTARQAGTTQVTVIVGGVRLAPVTLTVAGYADLHLVAGLQFVGLPVTPLADSLAALLAQPGVSARAFDPALQTYIPVGTTYTAGHGLWVQSAAALTQRLLGQATPDTAQRLPLVRGWNALANPFGQAVTWDLSAITVELNGVSLGSLVDPALWTGRVAPYGWLYSPDSGYRVLGDTSLPEFAAAQGSLPAYSGFWLRAETDGLALVLPPPTAARSRRAQAAPTHSDWALSLQAAQDDAENSQVIVGASGRLAQPLALALPPAARGQVPCGLTVVSAGGDRSAGEVRPAGPTQIWDLEVTSGSTAPVVLSWPGLGRGLSRGLVLDLADGNRTTLLNTRAAWRWQPSRVGEVRRLRLTARLGHVARSVVTSLSLAAGRGGGQSVALTLSAPAEVTLTVRGLGGRVVRQLHQSCGAGQTQLGWDGSDSQGRAVPPGSYRLDAEALAADGSVDRVTVTVTLTGR